MVKIDEYRYQADNGKFIVRKSDSFIMGEAICPGDVDTVDNYTEVEYTEESYKEFYESIGQPIPEEKEVEDEPKQEINKV